MTPQTTEAPGAEVLPDHLQLPDNDGAIVVNDQEHPQSGLLSGCLWPRLEELYGEQFTVGRDHGIYWNITNPPRDGCKAPDWYLVPGVPRMLDGTYRRSYVMWREFESPLVAIEYVSGDGSEERDTTPKTGKFWVYERGIKTSYYVIFDAQRNDFEVYHLEDRRFRLVEKNAAGRIAIPPLGIELGIWHGRYENLELPWLRAWDSATGVMLPSPQERAETAEALIDDTNRMREEETERAEGERKRADKATERAEEERKRAEKAAELAEEERKRAEKAAEETEKERAVSHKLRERLRQLGIDPDAA